jgi:hypothetical protein
MNFNSRLKQMKKYDFYKNKKSDKIYWVDNVDTIGEHLFTFDKVKIYNLFTDYPKNLTPEERAIFDEENQYWRDFFTEYEF